MQHIKLRTLNEILLMTGNDYSDVLLDAAAEIERLRRYADAMNGKPGTERHIYSGLCPDNTQPDSRDPKCQACRLLVPNA